ncbi:TolC family protein [Prevotella intermedia]|uniref:Transporter n=1 Tax=Prevotella intermedia TaxID=28131 RepID=A0A2D3N922_PREIN|nr:TolC family protein [Prevotella intermedia]ATV51875.1 transporter [Prevotella intermedia]
MKKFKTLIIMALLPMVSQAQTVTLDECQQLARENYPLIKQYDLIQQTTDFTVSNIMKGWLPQITAAAQATWQSDVMTLPNPLQNSLKQQGYNVQGLKKDQYRVGVELNQIVFDGGLMASQSRVAKLQGEVQRAQTDVDMYTIRQRVNDMYFGILLLNEKIQLNQDLQILLQSNLDKLSSLLKNGVAMQSDVNTVKAEKLRAIQGGTELAASKKSLVRMLSTFIGKDVSDVTKPAFTVVVNGNNRPELSLFDKQIQLTNAQEKALNTRLLPRLSLFAQGGYGYPGYDQFDAMFNHDWKLSGIIGARLVWNIDGLYKNKTDKKKIQAQRDLIEAGRETFLFNNSLLQIQQSEGIEKYRKLINEDDDIVTLRSQVRQSAESKLAHGIIDTNNLLQEITRENQAKIDRSAHEIQMLKEAYDLKHTTNK